jgi:hypothetical protein
MTLKFKVNKRISGIVLFILIGSILSYIYLAPFLEFKETMFLRLDWHKEFQMTSANWITLTKYHEFPFWNPYISGGNFLFAHPESHVLTPETIFLIIFGPITGLYFSVLFFYILGFLGCYFIGRHLKLTYLATLYLATAFTFSSYVMNNLFIGASTWMMFGFIPFAFYFLLKAKDDWRYGIAAGFFHAMLYLGGAIYPYMFFLLFAGIFVASDIIANRNFKFLKGIFVFLIFSILFASIKILPNLDLYAVNVREGGIEKIPFGFDLLNKAFFDKHQAWNVVSAFTYKGTNFHFPYYGMYIGLIPIILGILGIAFSSSRLKWALATLGVFLIYLSSFEQLSFIWEIIYQIPGYGSLSRQARILIYFALLLSITGAMLVSKIDKLRIKNLRHGKLFKKIVIAALIIFVFADLTKSGHIITSNLAPLPMQEGLVRWEEPFEYYDFYDRLSMPDDQIQVLDANYFKTFSHFNTLSNKGSIKRVYDPMAILPGGDIKSKGEPGYKGEYYFENDGENTIDLIRWTPNKISLQLKTDQDNLLLVNQNYHKVWKNKEGFNVINKDGQLAVEIPKGEHVINLYVFQNKIILGLLIFLISSVAGVFFLIKAYKS